MKLQTRSFVVRKPETIDITAFFKKFCIATRTKNAKVHCTLAFLFFPSAQKGLRRKIRRRLSVFMKSGAGYPTMKYRTMSAHSRYMIGWISLALPRTSLTSTCTMMPAPRPLVMVPVKAVNIIMTHGPMDSS